MATIKKGQEEETTNNKWASKYIDEKEVLNCLEIVIDYTLGIVEGEERDRIEHAIDIIENIVLDRINFFGNITDVSGDLTPTAKEKVSKSQSLIHSNSTNEIIQGEFVELSNCGRPC